MVRVDALSCIQRRDSRGMTINVVMIDRISHI